MKIQLILTLYDSLIGGAKIVRRDFCKQNGISERTFYRYMSEIGYFLMRHKSGLLLGVDEPHGQYFIEQRKND